MLAELVEDARRSGGAQRVHVLIACPAQGYNLCGTGDRLLHIVPTYVPPLTAVSSFSQSEKRHALFPLTRIRTKEVSQGNIRLQRLFWTSRTHMKLGKSVSKI